MSNSNLQDGARKLVHWLVVSPAAYLSLNTFWCEELGPDSMLAQRLAQGLVRPVDVESLPQSLQTLLQAFDRSATGPVVLVFDHLDETAYALLDGLPAAALQGLDIRLSEWRTDPQAVLQALDSDVLVDEDGFDLEVSLDDSEAWDEMTVQFHRADSGEAHEQPHIEGSPEGPAHEELKLSRSRDDEDGSELLMVEVTPAAVERYVGREVWVQAGGRRYPLGPIMEDGIAHRLVQGPVDFAHDQATLHLSVKPKGHAAGDSTDPEGD